MNWKLAVIGHRRRAIPIRDIEFWGRKILAVFSLVACCSLAAAADSITGAVHNQTRNQAAAGDTVILLRLDQGMQEEARATTDAAGAFAIKVQFPDKPHLIRIIHQGVNYDQRASAADTASVDVFDAATRVQGVTGSIEIIRTGTSGNLLHVSDMIELRNDSNPPMTQAGEHTLDVYLPAEARIDSVMAAGSGKIGVRISASPVLGEPGHYTVNFPLRPGSTRFAFNYDLPYDGHAAFRPRLAYPLQQLAVMIPPTMKFASRSPAFQLLAAGSSDYQVQAANRLRAGAGPAFEISGSGTIPPLQTRSQAQTGAPAGSGVQVASARESTSPAAGSAPQAPANDLRGRAAASRQAPALEWWLLGTTAGLALGVWGFLIWRARRRSPSRTELVNAPATRARPFASSPTSLLEALKEELLELETNRLAGSISRQEYDAAKRTLERTVKRALTQAAAKS
ncbi:MAG TPA: hypothetical protein VI488_05820 [Candidatus Angelobacter sp.]